jgi:hypothetical protein
MIYDFIKDSTAKIAAFIIYHLSLIIKKKF